MVREWNPGGGDIPTPEAERCKARVCGRSLARIADSNSTGGMGVSHVCVYSRDKWQKRGQSGQGWMDEVQRENKQKIPLGARFCTPF